MNSNRLIIIPVRLISRSCCRPKVLGMGSVGKKDQLNLKDEVELPVEKDVDKLCKFVCGTNLFIEGEDVRIKPDSEYPDWLWTMGAPPPLEEMDKNSKDYWIRIRSMREEEIKYLNSLQKNKSVHK